MKCNNIILIDCFLFYFSDVENICPSKLLEWNNSFVDRSNLSVIYNTTFPVADSFKGNILLMKI